MLRRRWVLCLLAVVGLLFAFAVIAAWYVGGQLVAPASRRVGPPPVNEMRSTLLRTASATIATWYQDVEGAAGTVILLHPIRADRRSMLGRAKLFVQAGYSVVLLDHQAHGESTGDKITMGHLEGDDVRAAVEFVRRRKPSERIGVVGRSLGGAAAVLASPLDVDALVLESVYSSIDRAVVNRVSRKLGPLANVVTPLLMWQLKPRLGIGRAALRPLDRMASLECPVLIVAGDRDEHTTLTETQSMYSAAREPKELLIFEGAAHVDLLRYDAETYAAKVLAFLSRNMGSP